MPRSEGTKNDTNVKTAQMVSLISEIGPDIPEISRRLGQFKESVRYRYKEKVLGSGFTVQATPDHEKLGLQRVLLIVDFAQEYKPYSHAILTAMNELCYVVSFERRMLTGDYLVEASVPSGFLDSFQSFVWKLKDKGLFVNLEVIPFEWFRLIPMQPKYYDFDTGRWEFDWASPLPTKTEASYKPAKKGEFDRVDLLVLKELQVDATRSLTDISSKLKLHYKKLAWHYSEHVVDRKLIVGYHLRWMGTKYNSSLERALHRQHRYLHVCILARDLEQTERMELMAKLNSVPFIWSEMVGKGDYFASLYFPTETVTESFQFLTSATASFSAKVRVMIGDQSEALSFTFSYQLFDEKSRGWTFNEPSLLASFEDLVQKIKE